MSSLPACSVGACVSILLDHMLKRRKRRRKKERNEGGRKERRKGKREERRVKEEDFNKRIVRTCVLPCTVKDTPRESFQVTVCIGYFFVPTTKHHSLGNLQKEEFLLA